MNVRQLEAFKAVYTAGSVSLAAEQMSITQPAVSTLISNLEKSIGFLLFERINGRLVETPEATNLYSEVERVFASLDRVSQTVDEIRTVSAGYLRIASSPGPANKIMPQVITSLLKCRPDVDVVLHTLSSVMVKEWVAMGIVDIGLAEMPINDKLIRWEPIIQRCVCILPAGHKLAKKDVITPHDLTNERLITLFKEHMTTRRLKQVFKEAGASFNSRLEVYLFQTCCNFVHEGIGIAFVDAISAEHYKNYNIIIRPFEPIVHYDMAIMFPANRPRSKLTSEFGQILRDWYSERLR